MKQRYAIYHKEKQKWSKGGTSPEWVEIRSAKIWSGIGPVKNHLRQFLRWQHLDYRADIENWVVVPIVLDFQIGEHISASAILDQAKEKELKKRKEWEDHAKKEQERREQKLLAQLKKKYES